MVRVFSIYIYGAQRGGLGIAFQAELKSNEQHYTAGPKIKFDHTPLEALINSHTRVVLKH